MLLFFQMAAVLMIGIVTSCGSSNSGDGNLVDAPSAGDPIVQISSFEAKFQYSNEPGGAKVRYVSYNSVSGNAIVGYYKAGGTAIDGNSVLFAVENAANHKIKGILRTLDLSQVQNRYDLANGSPEGSTDGSSMHMTFHADAYAKDVVLVQGASDAPYELYEIYKFITETFAFAVSHRELS